MAILSTVIGKGAAASKPASPATGYIYFSTDTGRLERYSGSAWEEIDLGGLSFLFSTTTTDGDPGAGTLRFNNGTPASVTKLFIDDQSLMSDADLGTAWAAAADAYLLITQASDKTKYLLVSLDTVTDDTGYFDIAVTVKDSGTLPDDGALLNLVVFGGGGGGGGYTEDQEMVLQAVSRGMIVDIQRALLNGTTITCRGHQTSLADTNLTDGNPSAAYVTGADAKILERGYPTEFNGSTVTTDAYLGLRPTSVGTYIYPSVPVLFSCDWLWCDNTTPASANRSFYMGVFGGAAHPTGANLNGAVAASWAGNSAAAETLGYACIVQASGGTAYFRTADGTTVQSTTLTGLDLFDGDWHDVAIYFNGTAWYAYVDGTFWGGHTTNVPALGGSAGVADGMWAGGPGVANDSSTAPAAGTMRFLCSYLNLVRMSSTGDAQTLLTAIGTL